MADIDPKALIKALMSAEDKDLAALLRALQRAEQARKERSHVCDQL